MKCQNFLVVDFIPNFESFIESNENIRNLVGLGDINLDLCNMDEV